MKKTTLFIYILTVAFVTLTTSLSFGQSTATYTITFNSVWNASDHGTLPSNAHWSKLVGATHNSNVSFLQIGQIASPGIEKVAEEGSNTLFNSEVNTSISAGDANQYINGNDLPAATGNIVIAGLQMSENFPLLTLVSMIAPSPDWMIAINGLNLRNETGWKDSIIVDVFCYDAGSDNGTNYTSSNSDTNPKQPISSLIDVGPFNSAKVGTFTIQLENVLGIENRASVNTIKVFPNPSKGRITIGEIQNQNLKTILIYNVLGGLEKKVDIVSSENQLSLNLEDLYSGIYLLKLTSANGQSKSLKLILE